MTLEQFRRETATNVELFIEQATRRLISFGIEPEQARETARQVITDAMPISQKRFLATGDLPTFN